MITKTARRFLVCIAIATVIGVMPIARPAQAADVSSAIEAGGTVNIDGADTFVIDSVNDGEPGGTAVITFADDATTAVDSLTISGDDTDNKDFGNLAKISGIVALDDNGSNTLILTGTNGNTIQNGNLWLRVAGDISGDVATDANDLRIVIDATTSAVDNNSILIVEGDIDLGSGQLTLTGDANNEARLIYDANGSQIVHGTTISTTDDVGSYIGIANSNTAATITFFDALGSNGSGGIANISIGANAIFNSTVDGNSIDIDANAASVTADFNDNVTGSTIIVEGGNTDGKVATAKFAGDVTVTSITLDDEAGETTDDAVLRFDGSSPQSVTGTITGAQDGEGQIIVETGSDVPLNNGIGGSDYDIDNFVVQSEATATLNLIALRTQQAAGTAIDIDGTLVLNTASGNVVISESLTEGGSIDIDGTLSVIGGGGNANISNNNGGGFSIDGTLTTQLSGVGATLRLRDASGALSIGTNSDITISAGNQIVTASSFTLGASGTKTIINARKTAILIRMRQR
ncbi:beta strand repeat-containing protein [Oleidesulfovibrio sp.]|uniref:beta strand repeat-containing protein n=1 Tax=Oleidesulfovibrio sp. TaxID=2909707 RepID=UPI003A8B5280